MQTTYSFPTKKVYSGDILSDDVLSYTSPALENMKFGSIAAIAPSTSNGYDRFNGFQNPSTNLFYFTADLIAANVVNLSFTAKATDEKGNETTTTYSITPVTYGVSHAATMAAIKAAIETLSPKLTAYVDSDDTNGRTIFITHADLQVINITSVGVTAGLTQAGRRFGFKGILAGVLTRPPVEKTRAGVARITASMSAVAVYNGTIGSYLPKPTTNTLPNYGVLKAPTTVSVSGEPASYVRVAHKDFSYTSGPETINVSRGDLTIYEDSAVIYGVPFPDLRPVEDLPENVGLFTINKP